MASKKQVATKTPIKNEPKITSTKEVVKLQKIKFKDTATAFCTANKATKILSTITKINNGMSINSFTKKFIFYNLLYSLTRSFFPANIIEKSLYT